MLMAYKGSPVVPCPKAGLENTLTEVTLFLSFEEDTQCCQIGKSITTGGMAGAVAWWPNQSLRPGGS